jgi:hypothetical protein
MGTQSPAWMHIYSPLETIELKIRPTR